MKINQTTGFTQFKSRIIFKDGKAYKPNKKPYTGRVIIKNNDGNTKAELFYDNGSIVQSVIGGNVFKTYFRLNTGASFEHIFSDGSKLAEGQFFDSKFAKTTVVTKSDTITEITKNNYAQYTGEPVLYIRKYKTENPNEFKEFKISKSDGKQRFEFKSLDEAIKYFDTEYGIEANFDNLSQAHIVKFAIDDFIKLNFNNEGKKLFQGLKIYTDDIEDEHTPAYILPSHFTSWNNIKTYNEFENINNEDKKIEFLKHKKPDNIELIDVSLVLNKNYNWQDSSILNMSKISNSLSGSTLKHLILHELAHVLHSSYCPYEYLIYSLPDTKIKEYIRSKVSNYAADCGTEFVAEYIAGKIEGKTYPYDVNRLYKKYSPVDIFGN